MIPEYTYTESQVRHFSEGQSTLTDLEHTLLNKLDELQSEIDELTGNA